MRYRLLLLLLLVSFPVFAQESYKYSNVVEVPSVQKEELYRRAKAWFEKTYGSKQVKADEKEGKIEAMPSFPLTLDGCASGYIHYSIAVYVKDEKYKYEVTNFTHKAIEGACSFGMITPDSEPVKKPAKISGSAATAIWKLIQERLTTHTFSKLTSLNYAMDREVPGQEKHEW